MTEVSYKYFIHSCLPEGKSITQLVSENKYLVWLFRYDGEDFEVNYLNYKNTWNLVGEEDELLSYEELEEGMGDLREISEKEVTTFFLSRELLS